MNSENTSEKIIDLSLGGLDLNENTSENLLLALDYLINFISSTDFNSISIEDLKDSFKELSIIIAEIVTILKLNLEGFIITDSKDANILILVSYLETLKDLISKSENDIESDMAYQYIIENFMNFKEKFNNLSEKKLIDGSVSEQVQIILD